MAIERRYASRIEVVAHSAPRGHAGVEVGNVEATESLYRCGDGSGTRCRVGNISAHEAPPQLVGDLLATGSVDVGEDDVRAGTRQVPRDTLADAVASTRDQGHFSFYFHGPDRRGSGAAQAPSTSGRGRAWTMLKCWMGRVIAT